MSAVNVRLLIPQQVVFGSCCYSEIRDEIKFMHVCMLPSAGRVRAFCNLRLQCLPYVR